MKTNEKKLNSKSTLEFLITTLNGMAHGLFATLIIGTIFATIGGFFLYGEGNSFCDLMFKLIGNGKNGISFLLQVLTGAGIGIGVAISLKMSSLKVIVMGVIGEIASFLSLSSSFASDPSNYVDNFTFKIGDPLTIYAVVIVLAILFNKVLNKTTVVDILIIPLFGVIVGTIIALIVRYPLIYVTYGIQWIVGNATSVVPALMGIIIAVIMGMALTAPISSAAIAAMVFTLPIELTYEEIINSSMYSGLAIASGAAIIGCCTQMIGFAIQSRKDNPIGMVLSIGIGTSMLQFKNILKKPIIWLPTIIASAILGPISTCFIKVICNGSSAGMGTAGLVGIVGTYSSMGNTWQTWVGIFILELLAPAILVFIIDLIFRKFKLIKDGDLKV